MKITGEWNVESADARRYVIVYRDQSSITLADNKTGVHRKIVLENLKDFDDANTFTDGQWWNFIFIHYVKESRES